VFGIILESFPSGNEINKIIVDSLGGAWYINRAVESGLFGAPEPE
jgi:hypothetical protein